MKVNAFLKLRMNKSKMKLLKFDLPKYYKDSEMTAYISERSRNSKGLKKYNPPKNEK